VRGNDFVKIMLRSPLHALLGNTMLITVTGRKTGRKITTPVNYSRLGDTLWILSTRDRTWWRNIKPGAAVSLRLNGREVPGSAELVMDEAKVAAQVGQYVGQLPSSASPLGIRMKNGVPDAEDTARLARDRLFVKVLIEPTTA